MTIPAELHAALGCPRHLVLQPDAPPSLFLYPARHPWVFGIHQALKALAKRMLGRHGLPRPRVARFLRKDGDGAVFGHRLGGCRGRYHVVNYHPRYLLMAADGREEPSSRETFWAQIVDYHEHRAPQRQMENAQRVTRWLVGEVLTRLGAASFLELGCGAGRNLAELAERAPDARVMGIDINAAAIDVARAAVPKAAQDLRVASLYQTRELPAGSVDVVFTSGVLMHVPHDEVEAVLAEMHRIARTAVVIFELHGPGHRFDYHRYPRDYRELLLRRFPGAALDYSTFPPGDFRASGTRSFQMALAVVRKDS